MKPRIAAITNGKGGCGKTTSARELGLAYAASGKRVLLIDADPQGNLTKSLTDYRPTPDVEHGLADLLNESGVLPLTIRERVDLLTGSRDLTAAEKRMASEMDCYQRLRPILSQDHYRQYDLILIDTPPSLGILTANALTAADCVLIPMNPAQYTMQGTNDLLATIAKARNIFNKDLDIVGVVLNALDPVPAIVKEIVGEIRATFGAQCLEHFITKSIRIEEAIAEKKGLVELPGAIWKKSREEVLAVAAELSARLWP